MQTFIPALITIGFFVHIALTITSERKKDDNLTALGTLLSVLVALMMLFSYFITFPMSIYLASISLLIGHLGLHFVLGKPTK